MSNGRIGIFGEVLFDCFPDGQQVLGGAPFNVAWHLQAFGFMPLFISRVGNDKFGQRILQAMQSWGMDISGLQFDEGHPTGLVVITLNNHEPSYDIRINSAYDFIDINANTMPAEMKCLYHGSLALRQPKSRQSLDDLKQHQSQSGTLPKIFMDVNLRQPWWQAPQVLAWVREATWVKLNQDELVQLQANHSQTTDILTQAQQFCQQYQLEWLVVTMGEQGAIAVSNTGEHFTIKATKVDTMVDTVGAGDAFASVLLLGLQLDWSLATSLERAQGFASAIVGKQGATVAELEFYQAFLQAWDLA